MMVWAAVRNWAAATMVSTPLCGMAAWLALPLRTMRIWSEAAIIGPGRTPILPLGSVGQT